MKKRDAFTFIEMLIVIAILAILALMALGSYGSARKSAQMGVIMDTVASSIKQQQGLAKSGKVVGDGGSKCYGMVFSKEADVKIQYVETPYYPVKKGTSFADYCALDESIVRDFENETDFELIEPESLLILFKPPFAKIEIGDSLLSSKTPVAGKSSYIKIGMQMQNGASPRYLRFDVITGLTERIYE